MQFLFPDKYLNIPRHVFHGIMLKFLDDAYTHDICKYRGAELKFLRAEDLGGPNPVKGGEHIDDWKAYWNFKHPDLHKWRLTYPERWGDDGVNAWQVTWFYIGYGIKEHR